MRWSTERPDERRERVVHHQREVERAALQHDLADDRPPGVEQVVGEAPEERNLATDDSAGSLPARFIDSGMLEERCRVGDRTEGIA